jgi:sulfatase modifying factor 1
MKSLLFGMFIGMTILSCGEEGEKEIIQKKAIDVQGVPLAIRCVVCGAKISKKTKECLQCSQRTIDSASASKETNRLTKFRTQKEENRQETMTERVNILIEKKEDFVTDYKLEMVWVNPGIFMMGSPAEEANRDDDESQHQVTLTKGFYLAKNEVTQAQWKQVMLINPSRLNGSDLPMKDVSWNDSIEFCKELTEMEKRAGRVPEGMSYQLPTEAQWEYACRAGTTTAYSCGDSISSFYANSDKNIDRATPVSNYPDNSWGFHDMHGNVWEWCADWYGDYPSVSVTNPIGSISGSYRVSRGGAWNIDRSDLRSAKRGLYPPSTRGDYLGLRVSFQSSK